MRKLVCGVGVSEAGEFARYVRIGSKWVMMREYDLWYQMLRRCYSEKHQLKNPTYVGCSVSEDFKYFQRFARWCQSQAGFGLSGYHLDKDILVRGNKVYSEETCVFVPVNINSLLTKRNVDRGDCPIGVSWHKRDQVYTAQCNDGNGDLAHLGYFTTPEAAFDAYKTYKEALIKRLAHEYRDVLDVRVFEALMAYEVNIDD